MSKRELKLVALSELFQKQGLFPIDIATELYQKGFSKSEVENVTKVSSLILSSQTLKDVAGSLSDKEELDKEAAMRKLAAAFKETNEMEQAIFQNKTALLGLGEKKRHERIMKELKAIKKEVLEGVLEIRDIVKALPEEWVNNLNRIFLQISKLKKEMQNQFGKMTEPETGRVNPYWGR